MAISQAGSRGGRVVVAGSINMDVIARVARFPVPGETLAGRDLSSYPGGKGANQAVAAARAGARVAMVGCVGDDAFGSSLREFLAAEGIDVRSVSVRPGVPTGTALILVDAQGENEIVVIAAANTTLDRELVAAVDPGPGDVLVAQYETPIDATDTFFAAGRAAGATNMLNPAPAGPVPADLLLLVDVLVVNETELPVVSGEPPDPVPLAAGVRAAALALRTRGFGGALVATLGARGAIAVAGDDVHEIAGRAVTAVDTTGAGDCFVGYLAAALARGERLAAAATAANAAASLCVQRPGAGRSMPEIAEVRAIA